MPLHRLFMNAKRIIIKQAKQLKPLWYRGQWLKYQYGEAWQIDYITLPQTCHGKHHVLKMNTILGLGKQVLWQHGTPERIESDNGTHFRNNLIDTWAKEHGTEWPMEKTMVKQVVPLQPMDDPHTAAGRCALKEAAANGEPMQEHVFWQELQSAGRTHARAVPDVPQPMESAHAGVEEKDQVEERDNWVYWTVWIRWPGTSDPQE
ncbi:hypothetical protein QYF61_012601 [Mycteria americana]|uniref:Integrase catalytic domain-containing protein n=1 Tax=Mycteria americana TaxID=33587 RepID=A0AAN7MI41_MYCAM|nr:hypothetical protein QYF61_012601 [Mycteria americana]